MRRSLVHCLMIVIFLSISLSGCGSNAKKDNSNTEEEIPVKRDVTEIPFKTINVEDAPDKVQKWISKHRAEKANKVFHVDGKTYVIVMLGQKSSGGFNVKIEQIQQTTNTSPETNGGNNTITVSYEETKPKKGSMNIQALTYPLVIAEIDDGLDEGAFQFKSSIEEGKLTETESGKVKKPGVSDDKAEK
ncbi:protease complex subunit PrcB family protein [Virgibacillus dakarensis]|nr:protease complex subunit PrcB family protein [Virgibacillus dakarensis]